jgi:nitrite reductase/ring-hydroxylating ferredoxin subunit
MSRYPFPATPDGWYGVSRSDELSAGAALPLRHFGRDLVLFRGEDGGARVFDGHCPHLGAHLGFGGRVVGDGIRCPFHGWRYDGAGCLVEIPGSDRKLPAIAVRSWLVSECNGFVHVWFHARGAQPGYDIERFRDDETAWTPWRTSSYRVRVHVQDLTENILDRAHFPNVHDMATPDPAHFSARFDGPRLVVEQMLDVTAVSAVGVKVASRTINSGPGVSVTEVRQGPLHMLNYITQTPIDDEHTDVRIHFSMKRLPDAAATRAVAELNERITNDQFRQDVPIWEHRAWVERPRLTELDGPIAQYRRWYRQFYSSWDATPAAPSEDPR